MSAEGTLRIAVEQIGAEDAAVALERVDEAMREVGTKAKQTGASTRGVFEPATSSARDFERALRGATGQGGPLARAPAQFALFGDAAKKSGRDIGMLVNSVSEMGYSALTSVPQFRNLGMSLAMAGGSAVTMGAALGPIGIALALFGNLLPAVIGLFSDEAEAIDDVGLAADQTTIFMTALERASVSAAEQIREAISQIERATEAEELLRRVQMGEGSGREQQGYLAQRIRDLGRANDHLDEFLGRLGLTVSQVDAMRAAILEGSLDRRRALLSALEEDERETALAFNRTFTVLEREIAQRQALLAAGQLNDAEGAAAASNKEKDVAITAARPRRSRGSRDRSSGDGKEKEVAVRNFQSLDELMGGEAQDGDFASLQNFDIDESVALVADELGVLVEQYGSLDAAIRAATEAEVAWAVASDETLEQSLKPISREWEHQLSVLQEMEKTQTEALEQLSLATEAWGDVGIASLGEMREAWDDLREAQDAAGRNMISTGQLMRATAKSIATEMADSIGGEARGAFDSAMQSILDGSKSGKEAFEEFTRSIIQSLVKRSIVEAAVNVASAVAAAARYDFAAAAQHGVAAAMWGAVGGVAAGVGVATGTLKTPPKPDDEEKDPAASLRPDRDRDRGGPQNIVVNVGTFPLSTQADIGRAVQDALDAAARRG